MRATKMTRVKMFYLGAKINILVNKFFLSAFFSGAATKRKRCKNRLNSSTAPDSQSLPRPRFYPPPKQWGLRKNLGKAVFQGI